MRVMDVAAKTHCSRVREYAPIQAALLWLARKALCEPILPQRSHPERRGRIRHNLRYSNLIAYIDGMIDRAD